MGKRKGNGRIGHNRPPKPICLMEGCEDEAVTKAGNPKESGMCNNCEKYMGRWMRKKPGEALKRRAVVGKWANRLDSIMPAKRGK